jgi:hypothetical protein
MGLWASLRGICQAVRVWGEEGSSQRLFRCSQLSGEYGMSTGELGMGMGSIGLREIRGVEVPKVSKIDFTSVTVPLASSSNVGGRGVEQDAGGRGG